MTNDPLVSIWTERYRPKTLDDIVLSKEDREFFESLATKHEIPHLLFSGSSGQGKTSLAHIITRDILKCDSMYINASDENSVEVMRGKIASFARTKSFDGNVKVVILDEACGMSESSQRILRGISEEYASTCRFILTCNYLTRIIPALQSRCQIVNLNPPIDKTVSRIVSILKKENITIPEDQKHLLLNLIKTNLPDIRKIVNAVQKNSVTGTLKIHSDCSAEFAQNLFKKICNKADLIQLRKEIIENEKAFSGDYRSLLKQIFERIYNSALPSEEKIDCMLIVSKGMENDSMVIDKEISCFATLINLSRNICEKKQ